MVPRLTRRCPGLLVQHVGSVGREGVGSYFGSWLAWSVEDMVVVTVHKRHRQAGFLPDKPEARGLPISPRRRIKGSHQPQFSPSLLLELAQAQPQTCVFHSPCINFDTPLLLSAKLAANDGPFHSSFILSLVPTKQDLQHLCACHGLVPDCCRKIQ